MRLGMDIGASGCHFVLLAPDGKIVFRRSLLHHNRVKEVVLETLRMLEERMGGESLRLSVCGSMSHRIGMSSDRIESELIALNTGVEHCYPAAASWMSIGAQNTFYVEKRDGREPKIRRNSNCSAGTGAFFEEQAGRLGIRLDEISDLVNRAQFVPHIAGRCSVFSKTDMIHHMQGGAATADLLMGICYALVRNYKANVVQNRDVKTPVLLLGGVMKNAGVVRAIKDLFRLDERDIILDENAEYLPAIGCALLATHTIRIDELIRAVQSSEARARDSDLPPLFRYRDVADRFEIQSAEMLPGKAWLGVDIGSTSINLVLLGEDKKIRYHRYVKNTGQPAKVVRQEIERLQALLPSSLTIEKIAVTGSGREMIGQAVGADLIINEITAQTEGAVLFQPDVETIFEIGGQDSKYMSLRHGQMIDFEMNKVCAAGTGAFLEEQIKKLGITMAEFRDYAMKSERPTSLSDRCTVFIESSITDALARGERMEDVCAGLAYAVANNYLNRVVNRKPIGEKVAIQGGIAYNEAVVCAFRALTGKRIAISPWFAVTGALGAASLCTNSQYLHFDKETNQAKNRQQNEQAEKSYLGDYVSPKGDKPVVGIPRVLFLHKMFPLFRTLFTKLGFDVLLTPLTTPEIVRLSQKYSVADTCYPVKLVHGHIAWLLEHKVDYIFLPRLYTIKHKGSKARKDYSCVYMQTSPLLMEQAFRFSERGVKLLMPELSLNFGKKFMLQSLLGLAKQLGKSKIKTFLALMSGMRTLIAHSHRLEQIANDVLNARQPVFVLVSRMYNLSDPILNMGIEEELHRMGCRVIRLEHLQASVMETPGYDNMCWPFGQHQITGMEIIRRHPHLHPIYITNHGCGPDTALQHYIETLLEGRTFLHLEVDEHSSRVGVITRLEAFLYSLNREDKIGIDHRLQQDPLPAQSSPENRDEEKEIWLLPELGIYTGLLMREVPRGAEILVAPSRKRHRHFNYAINKEYYSLLLQLEEFLHAVEPGVRYKLLFPTDEGAEVFSQYGHLMQQELTRRGFPTELVSPFIEDIPKRKECMELFLRMMLLELGEIAGQSATGELLCDAETSPATLMQKLLSVSKSAGDVLRQRRYKVLMIGEPLCLYKTSIRERLCGEACAGIWIPMPLSEALLFHWKDIDREGENSAIIESLERIRGAVIAEMGDRSIYTSLDRLFGASAGRLDFCVGNMARYRFAKLLSLQGSMFDGVLMVQSNEENVATILKAMTERYEGDVGLPVSWVNLDFEHGPNREEMALFMHAMRSREKDISGSML